MLDEFERLTTAGAGPTSAAARATDPARDRERAVLEHLAAGQTYATAAQALGIADYTAKNLAANAVEKLYRHARTEAVIVGGQPRDHDQLTVTARLDAPI